MPAFSLKQKLGACIYDLPRSLWAIRPQSSQRRLSAPWVYFRNRSERLIAAPAGLGVRCDWQWTSDLHVAKIFPSLGRLIMKRALRDFPVIFQKAPSEPKGPIEVSFIIGHRGMQRLPHLLLTLQSIAAQHDISFECIVVEQSAIPEVKGHLPPWVRYIHTPLASADLPYCRAWAFNVGARLAEGELLVLHDNDMLVTRDYAAQHFARVRDGYEVVSLKRFIFFLSRDHTGRLLGCDELPLDMPPESIMQNAEGGGSLAISREAYFAVGGFDESFVGWGGEDNEFWERAQTRLVWPYGYLPLLHLWHPAQPEKLESARSTTSLFETRSAIPALRRIAELTSRDFGNPKPVSLPPFTVHAFNYPRTTTHSDAPPCGRARQPGPR
jgi:hypothetical protein